MMIMKNWTVCSKLDSYGFPGCEVVRIWILDRLWSRSLARLKTVTSCRDQTFTSCRDRGWARWWLLLAGKNGSGAEMGKVIFRRNNMNVNHYRVHCHLPVSKWGHHQHHHWHHWLHHLDDHLVKEWAPEAEEEEALYFEVLLQVHSRPWEIITFIGAFHQYRSIVGPEKFFWLVVVVAQLLSQFRSIVGPEKFYRFIVL